MKKHSRTAIKLCVPFLLAIVLIAGVWPTTPSEAAQAATHVDHHGWQMDVPAGWDVFTSGGVDEPGVVVDAYLQEPANPLATAPSSTDGTLEVSAMVFVSYGDRTGNDPGWWLNQTFCYRCAVASSSTEPVKIGERWGTLRTYTTTTGARYWRLAITNDCFEYWLNAALAADATPETAAALDTVLRSIRLDSSRTFLDHCWG